MPALSLRKLICFDICRGKITEMTGEDNLKTLALVFGAYEPAQTGLALLI
ncbi:MAG: hypothetical protein ABI835_09315 [Chloroflexota bacterium]